MPKPRQRLGWTLSRLDATRLICAAGAAHPLGLSAGFMQGTVILRSRQLIRAGFRPPTTPYQNSIGSGVDRHPRNLFPWLGYLFGLVGDAQQLSTILDPQRQ
jgi:hypothetical protein